MPYVDIVDADTGETIAEGVYIPYDYDGGDGGPVLNAVSKLIMFILKSIFIILPTIVLLCLYPFFVFRDITNGTFNVVDSIFANPFVYIWFVFFVFVLVKFINKIIIYIKIKKCKNKKTTEVDNEVDDAEKYKKSELKFFMNTLQIIRYLFVGALGFILLWSLMPFLPELNSIYVTILSISGSYLYLISVLFYFLDNIINSEKEEGYIKRAIIDTLKVFFGFMILAVLLVSIVMLFSKSDNVLLPAVLLGFNLPFLLINSKKNKE